jgi:hypothetical protein
MHRRMPLLRKRIDQITGDILSQILQQSQYGKNRRFYLSDQIEDFFGLPRRRAKAARYAASNMACVRSFPNLWRAFW